MTLPVKNKFDPSFPIADKDGRPTQLFRDFMSRLDLLVTAVVFGGLPNNLVSAADDAAASAAGVPLGGLYRSPTTGAPPNTVSTVRVRVS